MTKTTNNAEPKYRFKTLQEMEATCENSKGAFTCGRDVFSTDMHHLLGLPIPDVFSEQIIDNKRIYLDLGDIVPGENNYWGLTPEMLTRNEPAREIKENAQIEYHQQFKENTFYTSSKGFVMYHIANGKGISFSPNNLKDVQIFSEWMTHPDNGNWDEFSPGDELDYENYFQKVIMEGLAAKLGYFVFPKAKEGEFPDLSGIQGEVMKCSNAGSAYRQHKVYGKIRGGFLTATGLRQYVRPLPKKRKLTLAEIAEKFGLSVEEIEIENKSYLFNN